jgi:predicted aspartyl protease
MKIKISSDEPIVFFVRVKGPKGTREFRAVLDTGCTDCSIALQDARALGYNAFFEPFTRTGEGQLAISTTDIWESDELVLEEVVVGDLVAKNVKAMTRELPRLAGIEGVIGNSFLRYFKTCLNFEDGYLTIEPISNKA